MENVNAKIDFQVNTTKAKIAAENRLIKALINRGDSDFFCGRQGLAFHGHRDDRPSVEENTNSNHGNFLGLLKFRAQAGDKALSNNLKSAAGNATYTSKTIQNNLITICGDLICNKILEIIHQACYFAVLADEATDIANHEQLSISIRNVDQGSPKEVFLGFHKCFTGVTWQAIADNILSQLEK